MPQETPSTEELLLEDQPDETGADKLPSEEKVEDELEIPEDKEDKEDKEETLEDDDIELITPFNRQALTNKYPQIFKEFPYLNKALERDKQFTETFGTLEEAKDALESKEQFENFQDDIFKGDIKSTLRAIKEADSDAFNRVVDGYMNNLLEVDPQAWTHVTQGMVKKLVSEMVQISKQNNVPVLQEAATIAYQFVFGNTNFQPHQNLSRQVDNPDRDKLNKEREAFETEKYQGHYNHVTSRIENQIKGIIENNIDKKEVMSPYIRKTAISDAFMQLDEKIRGDESLTRNIGLLWERARKNGYSTSDINRIIQTFVGTAKSLYLPEVIKKARNEALRGMGKKVTEDEPRQKGRIPVGRSTSATTKSADKPKIPAGMSTREYLMRDDV